MQPPWAATVDAASGRTYYYNSDTGETTWTLPDTAALPAPWSAALDPTSGRTYYYRTDTGETSWTRPNRDAVPSLSSAVPPSGSAPAAEVTSVHGTGGANHVGTGAVSNGGGAVGDGLPSLPPPAATAVAEAAQVAFSGTVIDNSNVSGIVGIVVVRPGAAPVGVAEAGPADDVGPSPPPSPPPSHTAAPPSESSTSTLPTPPTPVAVVTAVASTDALSSAAVPSTAAVLSPAASGSGVGAAPGVGPQFPANQHAILMQLLPPSASGGGSSPQASARTVAGAAVKSPAPAPPRLALVAEPRYLDLQQLPKPPT